ncbi:Sec-independent protein translocase subunit TatB [Corynebacterium antarcticum]|uniref:Sec-independent protein translocase protein TatB n=1 Tax=Corynebacterium antarcticum TaxID=2800405 RepID=A0ABS1FNF0_9CORY|nr:Sec-independent protein translocase subunit TatB [Corynebacterium antarcticum]
MFTNVGWSEIFVLFVVGLVVIGPERLPRVIEDVRAAILAARTAIDNAKRSMNEEFGPEFEDISRPLGEIAAMQRMGPRAVLTKTLFDGDDSLLDAFDPKKIMSGDTAGRAHRQRAAEQGTTVRQAAEETVRVDRPSDGGPAPSRSADPSVPEPSGGADWSDVT